MYIHTYIYAYIYIYMYICICVDIYIFVCMFIHIHVWIRINIHTYVYTYVDIYMYAFIWYIYGYVYIHVYAYILYDTCIYVTPTYHKFSNNARNVWRGIWFEFWLQSISQRLGQISDDSMVRTLQKIDSCAPKFARSATFVDSPMNQYKHVYRMFLPLVNWRLVVPTRLTSSIPIPMVSFDPTTSLAAGKKKLK